MKNKLLLLSSTLALALLLPACKSLNPQSGIPEYDPVKTELVKDAVEAPLIGAVRRVIKKNPETAKYFSRAAKTFTYIRDTKQFDPAYLLTQLDDAAKDEGWYDTSKDWVNEALDVKNSLVSLYKMFYNYRLVADLPEQEFLYHLCDVFSDVLTRGVAEAGTSKASRSRF